MKQSLTENQNSYSSCKSRWAQPQFVSNEPSKKSVFTLVSRAFPIFHTPAFPRDGLTPVLLGALLLGIWFSRFSYHVFIFLSVIEVQQERIYAISLFHSSKRLTSVYLNSLRELWDFSDLLNEAGIAPVWTQRSSVSVTYHGNAIKNLGSHDDGKEFRQPA